MWDARQSLTSNQLRDRWLSYVRGWWAYYQLVEERRPIFRLERWIRRHIRKCFWLRWHNTAGRERALRGLGVPPRLLKTVRTSRGAWAMAATGTMQTALRSATLRRFQFLMPSDLAAQ
jgi:RNA-directed DNA polymerase